MPQLQLKVLFGLWCESAIAILAFCDESLQSFNVMKSPKHGEVILMLLRAIVLAAGTAASPHSGHPSRCICRQASARICIIISIIMKMPGFNFRFITMLVGTVAKAMIAVGTRQSSSWSQPDVIMLCCRNGFFGTSRRSMATAPDKLRSNASVDLCRLFRVRYLGHA